MRATFRGKNVPRAADWEKNGSAGRICCRKQQQKQNFWLKHLLLFKFLKVTRAAETLLAGLMRPACLRPLIKMLVVKISSVTRALTKKSVTYQSLIYWQDFVTDYVWKKAVLWKKCQQNQKKTDFNFNFKVFNANQLGFLETYKLLKTFRSPLCFE